MYTYHKATENGMTLHIIETDASNIRPAQLLKTLRDSGTTDDSRRVPAGALRRVLREYADRFSRENGRVVATWRVLRVEALRI